MADPLKEFRYSAFRSVRNHRADSFNSPVFFHDLPGEVASPNYTFVLSGPPLADMAIFDPDSLTPIGWLQDFNFSAARAIQPVSEFGATRQRTFKGRVNYTANLSRILAFSGNLLGMLYRWAVKDPSIQYAFSPNANQSIHPALGENNHIVGMNSDVFEIPFGLYLVETTERGQFVSGTYWEGCEVAQWNKAGSANNVVILEATQLWIAQARPIGCLISLPVPAESIDFSQSGSDFIADPTAPTLERPQNQ